MKKRKIMRLATMVLAGCIVSFAQQAHGTVASFKAMGMGGATVALPQDSLTAVYNPAAAVEIESRWDLGLSYRGYKKQLILKDRSDPTADSGTFGAGNRGWLFPEFGINIRPSCNVAFGVALFTEELIRSDYGRPMNDFGSTTGSTPILGTTNLRYHWGVEALKTSLAYSFSRCHSVGLSVDLYAGRFRLDGLDRFDVVNGEATRVPGHLTNNGNDYTTGVGVTVGWIGHFTDCLCSDCLTLGVSFSPKVYMRKLDRYEGFFPSHGIDIPAKLRLGMVYQPSPCVALATDFEYRWYSDNHHYHNSFSDPGVGLESAFGTSDGAGLGWRDQWILKVGIEYALNACWDLRLGYRYEKLPYRKDTTNSFLNVLPDKAVEHIATLGATWKVDECVEWTIFGEYGVPNKEHFFIPEVTDIGGIGANDLVSGTAVAEERYYTAGLSFGYRF